MNVTVWVRKVILRAAYMVEMVIQQISNAELQLGAVSFHLVFAKPVSEFEVVKVLVVRRL